MSTKKAFFVIINPVSGNGKGKKIWKNIHPKLHQNYTIEFGFTTHINHEIELTKTALKKGFKHFIIIGGDGTLNKFITGVFSQNLVDSKDITFGVIAIGTGNDWIKTHNIPKHPTKALQTIINGTTDTQDVGCLTYLKPDLPNTYFINLCGIGFDGLVVNIVNNNRTFGKFTYIFGALKALFLFKLFKTTVTLDLKSKSYDSCFMIQLGICKYTGSGMQLTKQPNPKDGLFDISIATGFTKWDIVKNIISLFNGNIVFHKKIETYKTNHLQLSFNQQAPNSQADGEQIETKDMNVSMHPKAIRFYC
ncbi:diacylglycerol/lipid kinase family protein [Olleya sp. Bg11-27]|uniref:diacylglycerol/lipid kinase family protein n=1 Tax=Olleya sp. Bg11-27 TaxID=2058135 RepID=UPI000C315948|nr:diacylglycerol kinase family protein [Olleya sp. Bg11-27]AUC74716.1 hypothetical protein CW732_03100 [Olleya sp. Bg11-27]